MVSSFSKKVNKKVKKVRVLLIGIDGATWSILDNLISNGYLPNLCKLLRSGSYGNLESTIPTMSAAAWSSLYTGVNPGKHSVIDFIYHDGRVVSSKCIKTTKIWDILSKEGLKCCIINVPLTYPPDKVNGIFISGYPLSLDKDDFYYPKTIKLLSNIGALYNNFYKLIAKVGDYQNIYFKFNRWRFLEYIYKACFLEYKLALNAVKFGQWDFFMVVFRSTDDLQHFFWDYPNILRDFYIKLDQYIGSIIEEFLLSNKCGENYIIIVSDHGFGPFPKNEINLFAILNYYKIVKRRSMQTLMTIGYSFTRTVYSLLPNFLLTFFSKIYAKFSKKAENTSDNLRPLKFGIYVKDISLRKKILKILDKITLSNKEKLFIKVFPKNEVYKGPFNWLMPDIVFLPNPKYTVTYNPWVVQIIKKSYSYLTGSHHSHPEGIVLITGPNIKRSYRLGKNAKIYDIMPTILYLFGIPIPEYVDGNVIYEVFDENFLKSNPVKYSKEPYLDIRSHVKSVKQIWKRKLKF